MSFAERRNYQREERALLSQMGVHLDEEQACRECGCTDQIACESGCWWVQPDLCSACAEELEGGEL